MVNRFAVAFLIVDITLFLSGCRNNGGPLPVSGSSSGSPVGADAAETGEVVESSSPEQVLLWNEGNMPATTIYTDDPGSRYFDPPGFRPYMDYYPVKAGTEIKGAVLICPGGAFRFRSENDGRPVAEVLNSLGYQSFVVHYRLIPYTMQEGALDLARGIRYVRKHAEELGIDEKNIALVGFSAGGILCGEELLHFDGDVNGTILDPDYKPDDLDRFSADAAAVGMIYSFYGRLSFASTDVNLFRTSDLPPTYFLYGTRDPFVDQFELCVEALEEADVPVESRVLQDWPHGFGAADGQWIGEFGNWLMPIFEF